MSKLYKGIDISLYQGNPDFGKIKAGGFDFVMHKAGQGGTADYPHPFSDPRFEENVKACARVGGSVGEFYSGSYWYMRATTEAEVKEEAAYYIELLKKYRFNLQLWAAVDVEDERLPTDKATLSKLVKLFCDLVREAGFRPMVYTSSWWLENRVSVPADVPIWEANWSIRKIPDRAKMLQYGTVYVGGLGEVDADYAVDIIGDANGDGKVNAKDVAVMLKKVAGFKVSINESQADIDQDGYVTAKDVTKLMKLLTK